MFIGVVVPGEQEDAVDQRPDAEPAAGEELCEPHADVAQVEAADAEAAEGELEDARDDLRLVGVCLLYTSDAADE